MVGSWALVGYVYQEQALDTFCAALSANQTTDRLLGSRHLC